MPFTEQQVQMMTSGNEIIRKMYQRVCKERIEEEKEETKAIQDLCDLHHLSQYGDAEVSVE